MDKKFLAWIIYLSILLIPPLSISLYYFLKRPKEPDDENSLFLIIGVWIAMILGYGGIAFGMYLEDISKLIK